jgi:hypothetical protein
LLELASNSVFVKNHAWPANYLRTVYGEKPGFAEYIHATSEGRQ